MIHTSLHKYEQQGRRFIAGKANMMDHDLKFGTWVFTLGVTKLVEKKW